MFTAGRIVSLVLIAFVAAGLAYLRFGTGSDSVSVPKGAKAGDLTLDRCHYETEDGSYEADCGTLVVPENRADPQSRLIALPVKRIHARSDHPREPIFRLEGGPGLTNMKFAKASRFAGDHDVVLVGYRGVDGSVRLDCREVESALKHSTDLLGDESLRAYADAFRSCAHRLTDDGIDLAGYSVAQQVDDLEAARKALGYRRVDLLSESAGTRAAMIYAWRYPRSIRRSVMIGVNPPGHFVWYPTTTDQQFRRYAVLCSKDESCRKRTDNLAATIRRTATDIPDHWLFLPIKKGNVRVATFYGLPETTSEAAPLSAPMTLSSWFSADDGDASGFWFMSLLSDLAFPKAFVWGELAAFGVREDAGAAKRYYSSDEHRMPSILGPGNPGTDFIWGKGRLVDAWPPNADEGQYDRPRRSNVETLLVSGELDFTTPPQIARKELLPYLPNGHQVVLAGFGHTTSFWEQQHDAGSHLLNTFLDSGRVDDSQYKPQPVDFTPEVTQTALAKGFLGAMLGLALLTILSLVLMPLQVRRRGGFGRKASAALRSAYPVLLGFGGWFLGVLIVLTAFRDVPLDNELLAVLGVGVPVGLGIYWAWVRRDSSANTRLVGLAVAAAGALAGAWLGFHATEGLLALVTSIVGAIAGTNLALIVLDIWHERSVDRPVTPEPAHTSATGA